MSGAARFQIRKAGTKSRQRWYWLLIAGNGEPMAQSADRYSTKSNAQRSARRIVWLTATMPLDRL